MKFWTRVVFLYTCIWGIFGLLAFKVILGSFGALAIFPKIQFPKTPLLVQVTAKIYQTSPALSSQLSSQNYMYVLDSFEILKIEILTNFIRFL